MKTPKRNFKIEIKEIIRLPWNARMAKLPINIDPASDFECINVDGRYFMPELCWMECDESKDIDRKTGTISWRMVDDETDDKYFSDALSSGYISFDVMPKKERKRTIKRAPPKKNNNGEHP
jgi:hypothetical protein